MEKLHLPGVHENLPEERSGLHFFAGTSGTGRCRKPSLPSGNSFGTNSSAGYEFFNLGKTACRAIRKRILHLHQIFKIVVAGRTIELINRHKTILLRVEPKTTRKERTKQNSFSGQFLSQSKTKSRKPFSGFFIRFSSKNVRPGRKAFHDGGFVEIKRPLPDHGHSG